MNDSDLNFCLFNVNNYIVCHPNFVSELGSYKNLKSITSSKLNENEFIIIPEPEFTGCCSLNEQDNSFGVFFIKKYIKRVQFIK